MVWQADEGPTHGVEYLWTWERKSEREIRRNAVWSPSVRET